MAKKGQKFQYHSEEFILQVLEFLKKNTQQQASQTFKISLGTIAGWSRKKKYGIPLKGKQGRPSIQDQQSYKERYEILKKYVTFVANLKSQR